MALVVALALDAEPARGQGAAGLRRLVSRNESSAIRTVSDASECKRDVLESLTPRWLRMLVSVG